MGREPSASGRPLPQAQVLVATAALQDELVARQRVPPGLRIPVGCRKARVDASRFAHAPLRSTTAEEFPIT